MIGTALAIGLGVASAASSVGSSLLAKKGADNQAKAALDSSREAIAESRRQYEQTRADQMPWLTRGNQAGDYLSFLMGLSRPNGSANSAAPAMTQNSTTYQTPTQYYKQDTPGGTYGMLDQFAGGDGAYAQPYAGGMDANGQPMTGQVLPPGYDPAEYGSLMKDFTNADFVKDPGYDFRRAEGEKALERSAAARGMSLSGAQIKGVNRFNQDYASNEFGKAADRFNTNRMNRYNMLSGISGTGQIAAQSLGQLGAQNSTNIGNLTVGGQTAAAAARASGYNALGQGISGGLGNFTNFLMLSKLAGGKG